MNQVNKINQHFQLGDDFLVASNRQIKDGDMDEGIDLARRAVESYSVALDLSENHFGA